MLSISKIAREETESVSREARAFAEEKWLEIGFDTDFKELHLLIPKNNYISGYLNEAKEVIVRMREKGFEPQLISDITKMTIEEIEAVKDYLHL